MPVLWREQMQIGHEMIDADHRYLLALFNSVELTLRDPQSLRLLPVFFGQMLDYSCEHFSREEKVQQAIGFPGHAEHKAEHEDIKKRLKAIQQRIEQALQAPPGDAAEEAALQEQLRPEVLDLARKWVIDHILQSDVKMRGLFPAET